MKGAKIEPCEDTKRAPRISRTKNIGHKIIFFLSIKKSKKSERKRIVKPSVLLKEICRSVTCIANPVRIRRQIVIDTQNIFIKNPQKNSIR